MDVSRGRAADTRTRSRTAFLVALITIALSSFAITSSAAALSYGMEGGYGQGELNDFQDLGATVSRSILNFSETPNGAKGEWGDFEARVENAWKRGIRVFPHLIRSQGGTRFLLEEDPDWESFAKWAQAAVERFGVNGTFWAGKPNPLPITAWEIWNEPNLVQSNPYIGKAQCEKAKRPVIEEAPGQFNCVQPRNYGKFLVHTSASVQAGSIARTGHGTDIVLGGLYMTNGGGGAAKAFLEGVNEVAGAPSAYTELGIHPYSFGNGAGGAQTLISEGSKLIEGTGKSLWITEIGWPVAATKSGVYVTEAEQAANLKATFEWIGLHAAEMNIELVAWFRLKDFPVVHWEGQCGLRRGDDSHRPAWFAYQEVTGAELTGSSQYAVPTSSYELWRYPDSKGWGVATGMGLEPGTSPSIAPIPGGGFMIAFQDWQHHLWYYSTAAGVGVDTEMGMMPGTNPSIAKVPGGFLIAFQSWQGDLWRYSTVSGTGTNTTLGMDEGASPSLSVQPDGSYQIAFQANNHELWRYPDEKGWGIPTGMGMMAGTSPSIAYVPGGGHLIAFQSWQGDLWKYSTASGTGTNTTLTMDEDASPSLTVR